jgi:hypothetical protein
MSIANIFANTTTYEVLPIWKTAGRYSDPIGPENAALVLDTTRYGPMAPPSGIALAPLPQRNEEIIPGNTLYPSKRAVTLYDAFGREILKGEKASWFEIQLRRNLSSGPYFVIDKDTRVRKVRKIMMQK